MSFIFTEEWKEEAELIGELEKTRSELDDAKKEIERLNRIIKSFEEGEMIPGGKHEHSR